MLYSSLLLQLVALSLTAWLWKTTKVRWGWFFIGATTLFFFFLTLQWGGVLQVHPDTFSSDPFSQATIFFISFFGVLGLSFQIPVFCSMKQMKSRLQKHRIDLDNLLHKQISGLAKSNIMLHKELEEWYQAKQWYQENEQRFENIVQMSPMGMVMYELDDQQQIILAGFNPAANQIAGIDYQQLIGKRFEDIHPSLANTEFPEKYRRICTLGESWQMEQIFLNEDSYQAIYAFNAFQTSPGKMVVMFQDVTSQKHADEELKRSESKYRKLIETTSEGYCLFDIDGIVLDTNYALCRMSGYLRHDIVGKSIFYFSDEENQKIISRQLRLLETTPHRSYEVRLKKKNGNDVYAHINSTTLRDEEDKVIGGFSLISDVTEERNIIQALRESEERLRLILESTQDGVWENDFENNRHTYSDRMFTMLGYDPAAIQDGLSFFSTTMHPDDVHLLAKSIKSLVHSGDKYFNCECRFRCKDGSWKYILSRGKCLAWDDSGKATRVIGTHTDITDVKNWKNNCIKLIKWRRSDSLLAVLRTTLIIC